MLQITEGFLQRWESTRDITLFPHNGNDWPGKYEEAIQWAFVEFIKKKSIYETVFLIVADEN
jgi:agmatine deiminase